MHKMPITFPDYIDITNNSKDSLAGFLNQNNYSQVFVLVDESTKALCVPQLGNLLNNTIEIEIKSGEVYKTLATCEVIWQAFTYLNTDRNGLLINLGGGVIGDMGGFCASTYKRGIDFINIPTTLLSQVDASIGGKLGIDFSGFKNQIGLFNLPKKVIIDPIYLKTLPQNQIRSGFAEMLKHGFIKDATHLNQLSSLDITACDWLPYIKKSIEVKNEIAASDPYEKDERKLLNFGHTIGHAVESYFINNNIPILHGEAVAIGIITETYLSLKLGSLKKDALEKSTQLIDSFFERINIPEKGIQEILDNLVQDKKNLNHTIQAVLLNHIGKAQHSIEISTEDVKEALAFYNAK
jgi:3-dehydroquinate synthase